MVATSVSITDPGGCDECHQLSVWNQELQAPVVPLVQQVLLEQEQPVLMLGGFVGLDEQRTVPVQVP
jgi:hypothetical protein